jgi:hypothetical protein
MKGSPRRCTEDRLLERANYIAAAPWQGAPHFSRLIASVSADL